MDDCRTLLLLGSPAARRSARLLLENLPQVRRVDEARGGALLRLLLRAPLTECELIPLLASSGISGFGFS